MSISVNDLQNVKQGEAAIIGESSLSFKHPKSGEEVSEAVLVVGLRSHENTEAVAGPRYYLSPLVANTMFDDLNKTGLSKVNPAFTGRSKDEMLVHLTKNAK